MNDQNNNQQQNLANSPLVAFGMVKNQAQETKQDIQQKDLGIIAKRNQQVNAFLETLKNNEADLKDFEYFPTKEQLDPNQLGELIALRNQHNLQDLVPDDKLSPSAIISGIKANKLASLNKLFSPPEFVKIKNVEVDYNPFTYYKEPPPKENNQVDLSGYIEAMKRDVGKELGDKYRKEAGSYSGQASNPSDNITYTRESIQNVIDNYSGGKSPLTADDYIKASQMSGVPVDALLTQGALESSFGTKGRAVETRNVGNVGNVDSGANEYQNTWFDGLMRQANLLKNEYANEDGTFTAETFIANDFKRPKLGKRYATDEDYATKYTQILKEVRSSLYKPPVATNSNLQGDLRVLDTLTWGSGTADFISDSTPLSVIKPPLANWGVLSPTTHRQVAGAPINISKTNGLQINVGADFGVPENTDVLSSVEGVVVSTGWKEGGFGNHIKVKFDINGETYYTEYAHLNGWNVEVGQKVFPGMKIGKTGATGNVTGPHLDFSVYKITKDGRYQFIDTSSIFNSNN